MGTFLDDGELVAPLAAFRGFRPKTKENFKCEIHVCSHNLLINFRLHIASHKTLIAMDVFRWLSVLFAIMVDHENHEFYSGDRTSSSTSYSIE